MLHMYSRDFSSPTVLYKDAFLKGYIYKWLCVAVKRTWVNQSLKMHIPFWFVVHLCQKYREVAGGGGKKELHSKMYVFFLKPWIIALENILVVYMF